jgi:hypothetical protein
MASGSIRASGTAMFSTFKAAASSSQASISVSSQGSGQNSDHISLHITSQLSTITLKTNPRHHTSLNNVSTPPAPLIPRSPRRDPAPNLPTPHNLLLLGPSPPYQPNIPIQPSIPTLSGLRTINLHTLPLPQPISRPLTPQPHLEHHGPVPLPHTL